MNMILPYHDIASAAALAEASVCARPAAQTPGEDQPLFLSTCGQVSPVYKPSRWTKLLGAVLSPISGQTLSQSRSGASNI